jgi:hypothetical protein
MMTSKVRRLDETEMRPQSQYNVRGGQYTPFHHFKKNARDRSLVFPQRRERKSVASSRLHKQNTSVNVTHRPHSTLEIASRNFKKMDPSMTQLNEYSKHDFLKNASNNALKRPKTSKIQTGK